MIKRRSQRIDVALRTRAQILDLLERCVTRRVAKNAGAGGTARRVRCLGLGQSKVEQNYLAGPSNFQIVRFDVAMNDLSFVRMQVDKRVKQLIGPGDNGVARQWSELLRDYFRQVASLDKLHDEKRAMALGEVISDSRQRRMIEPGQQSRFPLKLFPLILVIRKRLLQRHRVAETEVDGFINRAHSTFSQVANHAIAALQNCIGREQGCAGGGFVFVTGGHCFRDPLEGKLRMTYQKERPSDETSWG